MHVHFLDPYRPRASLVHRLDARVKLVLALAFILSCSLTPDGAWPVYLLLLALALAAGLLLGAFFFGGLWWTVRKGMSAKRPALWFFGSLLLRMSIALAGFYFVSDGHWDRLLAWVYSEF